MTDDDDFEQLMEVSGVIRLGDGRSVKQRRKDARTTRAAVEHDADAEFAAAMAAMDGVPDKDVAPAGSEPPAPTGVRRLKLAPRARLQIDATLDMHGLHRDEAVNRLDLFVRNAFVTGARRLIVVTGKGHHSKHGVGVLREAVIAWILADGVRFVAAFGDAPKAHGGTGALVVELRPRD